MKTNHYLYSKVYTFSSHPRAAMAARFFCEFQGYCAMIYDSFARLFFSSSK